MLAIVLSRRDWREHDQTITCYTLESGKLELVARGIKKSVSKNSAGLEPGNLVEIETAGGKELNYLTTADPQRILRSVRSNLETSCYVLFVLKYFERLVGLSEPHKIIFELLDTFLEFADATPRLSRLVVSGLVLKLVSCLGFAPELDQCVVCGRAEMAFESFSVERGGVVCSSCAGQEKIICISKTDLETLQILLQGDWKNINQIRAEREQIIENTVFQFVSFHTGHELAPLRTVDKLLDGALQIG